MNMFDEFAANRQASGQSTAHVNMFDEFAANRAKNSSPRISGDYNKLFGTASNPSPLKADTAAANKMVTTARQLPRVQPVTQQPQKGAIQTGLDTFNAYSHAIQDPLVNSLTLGGSSLANKAGNYLGDKVGQLMGATPAEIAAGHQRQAQYDAQQQQLVPQTARNVLGMVGNVAGSIGAFGGLTKAVGQPMANLAGKVGLGKVGQFIASNGATMGAYNGINAATQGKSPLEILKSTGEGVVLGSVTGPLGELAGKGASKGIGALQPLADRYLPEAAANLLPAATHYAGNAASGATTGLGFSYGGNLMNGQPLNNAEAGKNATALALLNVATGGKYREPVSPLKMADINQAYGPENPNRITMARPEQTPLPKMAGTNTLAPTLKPATEANGGQSFVPQPLTANEPRISGEIQPLAGNLDTGGGAVKERQFSQSVQGSSIAPTDIKQGLADNKLTYEPITNKATFSKATQLVNADPVQAQNYFDSPSKGVSADDVALGEALITKAIKEGNTPEANRLIADLAEKLTTAGQAVQAASIFKKLTPEGMLLYAQRVVNSANKDLLLRKGSKAEKILLTAEDSDFILGTMKEAQALPDGREKDVAMAKVMQLIADKVPATLSEKIKGLQRVSLLLNPKTMIRNAIGNTIFGTIDNISNVVATPIDKVVGKLTGKRTTTLPSFTGQLKSGLQGAKETIQDARMGIDAASSSTQFDLPNKTIFQGKDPYNRTLNALDKVTKVGLQLGDRPFYKAAYDDSLRQQMKLAKADKPTQEMIDQANKIAQQRTYQDTNALTAAFKKAQSALNLGKDFGLGNFVLPFIKTPSNVLKRAVEYSPVGIEKAIREASNISKGTFDQKAFVDSISRSVTGTALIMLGYDLAKRGMITGSGNKDKDVAAFERGLGKNDYAYKVGDKYFTYDFAQPASMGLAIGADIYLKGKDRKTAENVVADAVKSGGETLFKQSLLQGVQRFMGGFSPIDNLATTAINAPSQFVPTLGKQITQLTDPIQRNTYSPSNLGTGANLIKAKIPGVSKSLEPKIDTFGNTVKSYQGDNSLFNIFVNPGNSTTFKPNKVQKEILRLYNATGDKTIFPKVAPKYFTQKGQRYDLTPQEVTTYQQIMGKNTEARMSSIVGYPYPDEVKAKTLVRAITLSEEDARKAILRERKAGN